MLSSKVNLINLTPFSVHIMYMFYKMVWYIARNEIVINIIMDVILLFNTQRNATLSLHIVFQKQLLQQDCML